MRRWVPQVREAALDGVDNWLTANHAPVVLDVLSLTDGGRFGPGRPADDLRNRMIAVLQDPLAQPTIQAGVESTDRFVRRACVWVLVETQPDVALLQRVLPTHDVVAISLVSQACRSLVLSTALPRSAMRSTPLGTGHSIGRAAGLVSGGRAGGWWSAKALNGLVSGWL